MIITYYGHSCFKLRSTEGTVATDPFSDFVGFEFPNLTADIVTVSHDNPAHNNYSAVGSTSRRKRPFIIDFPGEYEVGGISVFGVRTYCDGEQGAQHGENHVFTFLMDDLRACHLGSLGHELTDKQIAEIGLVDILFAPVGGVRGLDAKTAVKVARSLEPNILIPMQYKTPEHNQDVFADFATLEEFLKEYEAEPDTLDKLNVSRSNLPEEMEIVVLERN